jgi:hypothetical protein
MPLQFVLPLFFFQFDHAIIAQSADNSVSSSIQRTLVYLDPSSHPSAPGWTLRNLLSYLTLSPQSTSLSLDSVRLLLVRESSTISTTIRLKSTAPNSASVDGQAMPGVVGWEKNPQGSLGPRMADLGPLMDPVRLADQAVDLNLQLMRWRILPELDLDKVKGTKCLVLGAGTLGCYVSRTLMVRRRCCYRWKHRTDAESDLYRRGEFAKSRYWTLRPFLSRIQFDNHFLSLRIASTEENQKLKLLLSL